MKFAAFAQKFFDERAAKIFAAGRFWGLEPEVRIGKEFFEEAHQALAVRGDARPGIEALAAFSEVGDKGVDDDVGRARVEGEDLFGFCVCGDDRDVRDAAQIKRHAAKCLVAVKK